VTNSLLGNGLFGALFCDPDTALAFSAPVMLDHMIAVEAAWIRALIETGSVETDDGDVALHAVTTFDVWSFQAASDKDGLPVPSLVAHLRQGLPPGPASVIHAGLTSQDVIDTALVLTLLDVLDTLDGRLRGLSDVLERLERDHGSSPLMARTRMQAALPATVSLRVCTWRWLVRSLQDRLPEVRFRIAQVQVGGAIGLRDLTGGVGSPAAERLAHALGLRLGPVWHTERTSMVELGHWFTLVTGALGKIGQDVALMAQQGVDEITLVGGGGSSAMPHKANPILAETLVAIARHVAGQQGTLAQAMIHEQERSGSAWALEWLTLPAMAEATGAALHHAGTLCAAIQRIGAPG
jgi:3-carboxy-cis,cis-muconate cycloisomerase